MVNRMIPNHVHNRRRSSPGIVQVRQPIRQSGSTVQKSGRRFVGNARVPVCAARRNAFKKVQNTTHSRGVLERGDEMQFAGSRVGKADVNSALTEGLN